ncbi:MAG: hypothetical protein EA379_07060 [Phycisphaerales bacterium]|nr:MAG: hypothetical protein EA379_07060 [Phycisphaerales bacterium]
MHDHDDAPTLLIVTGSVLDAERNDRPIAYALRERINAWTRERLSSGDAAPFEVIVCSDLWWLNNEELALCPTISVGAPESNALSAYLGDKLPSAYTIENSLMVQADLDFRDLLVCCWGRTPAATNAAVQAFEDRYLEHFMLAASERVGA